MSLMEKITENERKKKRSKVCEDKIKTKGKQI